MVLDAKGAPSRQSAGTGFEMRDAQAPALPYPRMPVSQRAKIFNPFDPLHGYRKALREKEIEAEAQHCEFTGPSDGFDAC